MSYSRKDSPCIGICSTVYGDDVCRGCKRFYQEIIDWNSYGQPQRDKVYDRIDQLLINVMQDKISVENVELLEAVLAKHEIRYRQDDTPYGFAYLLLRDMNLSSLSVADCGIKIKEPFTQYTLSELIVLIDDEYYEMANQVYCAKEFEN